VARRVQKDLQESVAMMVVQMLRRWD